VGGINFVVRHVVMPLDVIEVHSLGDAVILVEVFQITSQVGVIGATSDITFEMSMVHDIEADERDKQAPIGFDEARAKR
jgi:hypothetical protein